MSFNGYNLIFTNKTTKGFHVEVIAGGAVDQRVNIKLTPSYTGSVLELEQNTGRC